MNFVTFLWRRLFPQLSERRQRRLAKRKNRSCYYMRPRLENLEARRVLAVGTISIADSSIAESASGTVAMNFTVTRTGDLTNSVTVGYTTGDGTAHAGTDYTAQTGTVTIVSGASTAIISIPILTDSTTGSNENFSVTLTGVSVVGPAPTFQSRVDFTTANTNARVDVKLADINGDGRLDVVLCGYTGNTLSVFLNSTTPGSTTPTFAARQDFTIGATAAMSVAIGDLNGDGRPDIVVAGSNTVVLLNTTTPGASTASFGTSTTIDSTSSATAIALADLNHDGKLDVAVVDPSHVDVLLNTTASGASTPSFSSPSSFATGLSSPYFVNATDMNDDGSADLVISGANADGFSVLLNTMSPGASTASFAAVQTFTSGAYVVADFNSDGLPDVAFATPNVSVGVRLNTTVAGSNTLSFGAAQITSVPNVNFKLAVGDFNSDGHPDLLMRVLSSGSTYASVLVNATFPLSSTVTFRPRTDVSKVSDFAWAYVSGDLNNDGLPDIVLGNATPDQTISVLLNSTTLPAGTPDLVKTTFASSGFYVAPTVVDVNDDGKLDIVTELNATGKIAVFLNNTSAGAATPTFASEQDFTDVSATGFLNLAISDFNNDGKPDIVCASGVGGTVSSIFINNTSPGSMTAAFTVQRVSIGSADRFTVAADVNTDGRPDLIATLSSSAIKVLLNTTTPGASTLSFSSGVTFTALSQLVALGPAVPVDINGDGLLDIVEFSYNSSIPLISVLFNTTTLGGSTPSFLADQEFSTTAGIGRVVAGDLNGDGKPDLAATLPGTGTGTAVTVLLNTTVTNSQIASFSSGASFTTGTKPSYLAISDVTGDGKPDLLTANVTSRTISLLQNTTAPGASTPTFASKVDTLFSSYGLSFTLAAGDLNGDGRPDVVATYGSTGIATVLKNAPFTISRTVATGTILETTPVIVTTSSGSLNYNAQAGAKTIDSGLTIADSQRTTIASATVTISANEYSAEDVLGFTNQNGITGSFSASTGILTLSGTTTLANYQTALRSVMYTDSASVPTSATRLVSFAVNDGLSSSAPATRTIDVAPGSATQLVVTTQPPASVIVGSGFGLSITMEDSQGDVDFNYSGNVTVGLAANPGGATLGGTLTIAVSSGVVSFSGLWLNKVGTGYTLQATSGSLPSSTSAAFNVVPAPSFSWTGLGADQNWTTGANWQGGTAPTGSGTEDIIFPAAPGGSFTSNNDLSGASFDSLTFQGGGYLVTGNAVTISGRGNSGVGLSSTGTNVDQLNTTLFASQTFTSVSGTLVMTGTLAEGVNPLTVTGAGNITLSGVISGGVSSASNALIKGSTAADTGTLTLNGSANNTFTGITAINDGIANIQQAQALGTTNKVTIASSTVLQIQGGITTSTIVSSLAASGAIESVSGTNTLAGNITLTKNASANQPANFIVDVGTLTLAGVISNGGAATNSLVLTLAASGTLVLTGSNSYGATTINSGTLQIGNGGTTGTLGSGAVTDNAVLVFNRSSSYTVSNIISGTGSLTQAGSGTLALTGTNSYTGATAINAGILSVGTLANGGANSNIGASSNSAVNFVINGGWLLYTGSTVSTDRLFTIGAGGANSPLK